MFIHIQMLSYDDPYSYATGDSSIVFPAVTGFACDTLEPSPWHIGIASALFNSKTVPEFTFYFLLLYKSKISKNAAVSNEKNIAGDVTINTTIYRIPIYPALPYLLY
jgi:hypothetical protein